VQSTRHTDQGHYRSQADNIRWQAALAADRCQTEAHQEVLNRLKVELLDNTQVVHRNILLEADSSQRGSLVEAGTLVVGSRLALAPADCSTPVVKHRNSPLPEAHHNIQLAVGSLLALAGVPW